MITETEKKAKEYEITSSRAFLNFKNDIKLFMFEWNKENRRRGEQRILISLKNSTNTYFKTFLESSCLLIKRTGSGNQLHRF